MKITAKEAKELAGPTIEEYVDEVFDKIRTAATTKKREIRLKNEFWVEGGYGRTQDWVKACKLLTDEGFEVEFFYEELQFVNMYTVVKW